MLQFNFDATKGETPASIAQKRALVAQIMGSQKAPTTFGEGLSALGDGIVANVLGGRAAEAEKVGQAGADETRARLVAALSGQGAPMPAATATAATSGAANSATPSSQGLSFAGDQQAFIEALMPGAIEASRRTGIDPRIIIAQAAQESGWGKSAPGNNLFGIKSHGQGGGQNLWTTEEINGQNVRVQDSFRTYESPSDSISGYADFILQNPRYRPFMGAQGLDAQLEELGRSGYATDSNYVNAVGSIARGIALPDGYGAAAPGPVAQGPDMEALLSAISNPFLDDGLKSVAMQELQRLQQQNDPMHQLQMQAAQQGVEKGALELEALRNPTVDPWSNAKVINDQVVQMGPEGPQAVGDFRTQDQYRQLTPEEISQRGLDPSKVWQVGPDNKLSEAGGSLVTVNTGDSQTPGWKKIDEAFAPLYFDWQAGGWADTGKQVEQLNEALGILESGQEVTGPMQGAINRLGLGALFNQDGTIAKENVEEVVQRSLREILGAQFTENEGQRLIARAFNDQLPPAENAKRVRRLLQTIQGMADSKQAMVDHFNANGTLYGYQGKQPTLAEIRAFDFGDAPGAMSQPNQSQPAGDIDDILKGYGL